MEYRAAEKKKIIQIPAIQQFSKLCKPTIEQWRKQDLQEKLVLQKAANVKVSERTKKNDLMLTYDRNPFLEYRNIEPMGDEKPAQQQQQQSFKEPRLIVDQIASLTEKPIQQQFLKIREEIGQEYDDQIRFSKRLQQDVPKVSYRFGKKKEETKKEELKEELDFLDSLPKKLDQIVRLEEENINFQKRKDFKLIDEVLRMQDGPQKSFLDQHHFVYKTHEPYSSDAKLGTYRDLSKMARRLVQSLPVEDNVEDHLDPYELSFNVKNLNVKDMLNIASGRFSPIFLLTLQFNSGEKLISKQIAEGNKQPEPEYQPYQTTVGANTADIDVERFEIECLRDAPLLEEELEIQRDLQTVFEQLQRELREKSALLKGGVVDQNVHEQRKKNVMNILKKFKDTTQLNKEMSLAEVVQHNTRSKRDKKEELLITTLKDAVNETIKYNKQQREFRDSLFR